ncbi:MAG TPA: biotin--[acetyl-CoA-carboxylase] ligase [Aliidongia sp.]|nr:biotin--[acetyl-CoA-carboxylase] ligase [Aliidongia sp.]
MSDADGEAISLPSPFRVLAHDSVGSTSDEAKTLAEQGAAHGTIVWAIEQTKGRGRLDRNWVSPRGNLFMSAVLRPDVTPARAAELGFVASLAVSDMVASFLPDPARVQLKWPNDVLVDGAKLSGILLEARSAPSGKVEWVVLGIGVNIVSAPTGTPYPATFLHALGGGLPDAREALDALGAALAARIAEWQARGFAPIRQNWLIRARGIGQVLEVRQGAVPLTGRFRDLDPDGALLLETDRGLRRITAGDVYFPEP